MDKKTEQIIKMLITKLGDLPTTGGRSIVERRPPKEARFTKKNITDSNQNIPNINLNLWNGFPQPFHTIFL